MTSTEQLVVPPGATARIKKETKAAEAAETLVARTPGMLFAVALVLAAGSGLWVSWRTADIPNTAMAAGAVLLCALAAAFALRRDHHRWMDKLAARAREWDAHEARLRVQLTEQLRREQEVWVEHAKLTEQVFALTSSNAGLA